MTKNSQFVDVEKDIDPTREWVRCALSPRLESGAHETEPAVPAGSVVLWRPQSTCGLSSEALSSQLRRPLCSIVLIPNILRSNICEAPEIFIYLNISLYILFNYSVPYMRLDLFPSRCASLNSDRSSFESTNLGLPNPSFSLPSQHNRTYMLT